MKTALVLACDDNFIPYTCVVARDIIGYAAEKFPIVVVSDNVSDENKTIASRLCPAITFIEAAFIFRDHVLPITGAFTRATYLRLYLDEILADFDRAVYLDSDISVLTDVSPLLSMIPRVAPIIAAHDVRYAASMEDQKELPTSRPYFNGGVQIYDLKAVRQERIFADALRYAVDNPERCALVDQDALNAVLAGRWQTLDWRWNVQSYKNDLLPKQPFIRHFAHFKPWGRKKLGVERRFIDEWRAKLADGPWPESFREEAIKYPIKRAFRSLAAVLSGPFLDKKNDRQAQRTKFAKSFAAIERAAAAGAKADWLF